MAAPTGIRPFTLNYGKGHRNTLDGYECMVLWYTPGMSLDKAADEMNRKYGFSSYTGQKISRHMVYRAAWAWIIDNPQRAIDEFLKPVYKSEGIPWSDDQFWATYVAHLYNIVGKNKRIEKIKVHGLERINSLLEPQIRSGRERSISK